MNAPTQHQACQQGKNDRNFDISDSEVIVLTQ